MLRVVTLILLCQAGMNHSAVAMDIPDLQDYSQAAQAAYQERELMQRTTNWRVPSTVLWKPTKQARST
jgi:hypothetical protein